ADRQFLYGDGLREGRRADPHGPHAARPRRVSARHGPLHRRARQLGRYDPGARTYELTVAQKTPPTPGQDEKAPVPIPLAMGLLGPNGDEMPTRLAGEAAAATGTRVVVCDGPRQTFRFVDVAAPPVPSLLRRFSAPVKLSGVPLD